MKVDVRELVEPSGRFAGEEAVTIEDPVSGEITVPCSVQVEYRQSPGTIYLQGIAAGTLLTQCHRCLDPVRRDINGEFELIVRRGEHGGEDDDVVMLPPHQYDVDLAPYVHEAIVLSTPMVILCREDCRGLCPSCGANWNRQACACRPNADPRWDALRKLW